MDTREGRITRWVEERRQLAASGLSRREVARMGLLVTAGGVLVGAGLRPRRALADGDLPASPRTTPWTDPMPVPPSQPAFPTAAAAGLDPPPDPSRHQYWAIGQSAPRLFYRMTARRMLDTRWAPEIAQDNESWGYEGQFPGPTLDFRYGTPVLVRHVNALPDPATFKGFAYPGSITHLHNFHTASESDGGPWRYTLPGEYTDHHYAMNRAGFSLDPGTFADPLAPGGTWWAGSEGGGDLRETLTTLFYHQHMPGFTAANVYRGLVGFCRVFDAMDTGDETRGWRLPSDPYDLPVVLADKRFDADGQLYFDPFTTDGFLGDKLTVNGRIQPYLVVKRRKYRFRFLNAGPSRFYTVVLRGGGKNLPMTQVTDGGNLLERPVTVSQLELWVAERSDVVVDFTNVADGSVIYMANILPMRPDGRGAIRGTFLNPDDPANQLVKIVVSGSAADASRIPTALRPFPFDPAAFTGEVKGRKTFNFDSGNGGWVVNGVAWDPDVDHTDARPGNQVRRNTAEVWTLINSGGGWEHPIHMHLEEGMVISRNGVRIARPTARQDVYRLGAGTTLETFMRFRDYPQPNYTVSPPSPAPKPDPLGDADRFEVGAGRYVMHCHNVVHEDHAMMTSFTVVP